MSKTWCITGASRGIGLAIAQQALAAGEQVVATGRDPAAIQAALGTGDRLLVVPLDVSQPGQADTAAAAALQRFGRVDVLVNNAGYGQLGPFEECSDREIEQQFRVNVFGSMETTRAFLPAMRAQRSGHIFTITSIGGLRGGAFSSLYCSTKFALEGWSESLAAEVAPFGIHVTAVEPGFFRTDFLDSSSIRYAEPSIPDYRAESDARRVFYDQRSHNQAGDPVRLATAMLQLADHPQPPLHFLAGTDAIQYLQGRIDRDTAQLNEWRTLSASTDFPA